MWFVSYAGAVRVAIAGAHGRIGLRLVGRVAGRGDTVVGLIRNPDHAADVRARGGEPVTCDLEHATLQQIAAVIEGADAVVFAAGAGPGSGAARKLTMDRDGAILLLEAATSVDVPRFVIVSSVGAESPPDHEDVFSVYLRAKAQADATVQASNRQWTIVRPGRLIDDPGTGRVRLDSRPFRGAIPRDDVAAVLEALLLDPRTSGRVLYAGSGDDELADALEVSLRSAS
jgi:nucleoside-diphosphate-sugar epimerase